MDNSQPIYENRTLTHSLGNDESHSEQPSSPGLMASIRTH